MPYTRWSDSTPDCPSRQGVRAPLLSPLSARPGFRRAIAGSSFSAFDDFAFRSALFRRANVDNWRKGTSRARHISSSCCCMSKTISATAHCGKGPMKKKLAGKFTRWLHRLVCMCVDLCTHTHTHAQCVQCDNKSEVRKKLIVMTHVRMYVGTCGLFDHPLNGPQTWNCDSCSFLQCLLWRFGYYWNVFLYHVCTRTIKYVYTTSTVTICFHFHLNVRISIYYPPPCVISARLSPRRASYVHTVRTLLYILYICTYVYVVVQLPFFLTASDARSSSPTHRVLLPDNLVCVHVVCSFVRPTGWVALSVGRCRSKCNPYLIIGKVGWFERRDSAASWAREGFGVITICCSFNFSGILTSDLLARSYSIVSTSVVRVRECVCVCVLRAHWVLATLLGEGLTECWYW